MSLVPRCLMIASPFVTLSFAQKYRMSMCLVCSAAERPLPMNAIVLMLSWYTVIGPHSYPCAMMKARRCSPWLAESDSATSFASVKDLVTICCSPDLQCTDPVVPITMQLPVCDLPSSCTPYATSIYTFTTIPPFPGRSANPRFLVSFTYRSSLISLSQSCSVHLVTRIARNATAVRHSGLEFFAR